MSDAPTTYTGAVKPGGPADVRELGRLTITKVAVDAQMSNNCYLLRCRTTGEQLLIDAAAEPETLLPLIGEELATVVTTHQHWDHHRALRQIVADTGAQVLAGAEDADALPAPVDVRLADGDTLALGHLTLEAVALRGHTPGSVALAVRTATGPVLFTGDSLFPGGVGKTGSPDEFASLIDDVEQRLFDRYPDETVVHPGHGDSTTLGAERPHLPQWRERGW